jgi:hypothetical protein
MNNKSTGHIFFFTRRDGSVCELYADALGNTYTAPISACIDIESGYRIGRFEGPAHYRQYVEDTFRAVSIPA